MSFIPGLLSRGMTRGFSYTDLWLPEDTRASLKILDVLDTDGADLSSIDLNNLQILVRERGLFFFSYWKIESLLDSAGFCWILLGRRAPVAPREQSMNGGNLCQI